MHQNSHYLDWIQTLTLHGCVSSLDPSSLSGDRHIGNGQNELNDKPHVYILAFKGHTPMGPFFQVALGVNLEI